MDWPEPPAWLMIVVTVVIAPLWALFVFAWMLHELAVGLWRAMRRGN